MRKTFLKTLIDCQPPDIVCAFKSALQSVSASTVFDHVVKVNVLSTLAFNLLQSGHYYDRAFSDSHNSMWDYSSINRLIERYVTLTP